jgi:hypothetical protein
MPKSRSPVDLWYVRLMIAANGDVCACCGKPLSLEDCTRADVHKDPDAVQRGHIVKRNPDGSNDEMENLVPVHKSCNNKHTRSTVMPFAHLSTDYFLQLGVRLLKRIPVKIPCRVGPHENGDHPNVVLTTEVNEKTVFIDLGNSKIETKKEVSTWSSQHGPLEAKRIVDEVIESQTDPRLPAPFPKVRDAMIELATKKTREAFLLIRDGFLHKRPWVLDERTCQLHRGAWETDFVGSADAYEKVGRRLKEAEEKKRRDSDQSMADFHRMRRRENFLKVLRFADSPALLEVPDAKEWFDHVKSRENSPGDVTEEESRKSLELLMSLTIADRELRKVSQESFEAFRRLVLAPLFKKLKYGDQQFWSSKLQGLKTEDELKSLAGKIEAFILNQPKPAEVKVGFEPEEKQDEDEPGPEAFLF